MEGSGLHPIAHRVRGTVVGGAPGTGSRATRNGDGSDELLIDFVNATLHPPPGRRGRKREAAPAVPAWQHGHEAVHRTAMLDVILQSLGHPGTKERGIRLSGHLKLPEAVGLLSEIAVSGDAHDRLHAVGALGRIGGAEAMAALLEAQVSTGRRAIALARAAGDVELGRLLGEPLEAEVLRAIVIACGIRHRSAMPERIARLGAERSRDRAVRAAAVWALSRIGDRMVPVLNDLRQDPRLARAAGRGLKRLGKP